MEEEKIQHSPQNDNNDIVVSTEIQSNNQQSNSGEPISTNNNFTKYMQKNWLKQKEKVYNMELPYLTLSMN